METAVCFDVFGTLIHYAGRRVNPYRRLIVSEARLPFLTRNVGIEVFAEELGLSALLPSLRHELEAEINGLQLFPEVEDVFKKLRSQGKKIAVCSNLAYEYGTAARALLPAVDATIFSYEVGASKPDPAIYAEVCERLKVKPKQVFFIGDSPRRDEAGPHQFGMRSALVKRKDGETLWDALRK